MDDTAQAAPAETPVYEQIDSAAAAIRAMRTVSQPRDDSGRFAGEAEEPEVEEAEAEPTEDVSEETDEDYEDEAPEEDQAEPVEMPKSWSKEDEEVWHQLPPAAQAKIAEREGQRDAAINSKFQEAANARKEFESRQAEANSSRDKWAQDYDLLVADLELPKPDPRQWGLGTQNYDSAGYELAKLQYEEGTQHLQQLRQQREEIRAQQDKEALESWNARKAEIEAAHRPTLMNLMPEISDPQKAEPALRELVQYALNNGLEPEAFSEENQQYITSAQLALLAKAKKYDELSKGKSKPEPKKQPAVRPGVATPRSAQQNVQRKKAMDRLATENSIEAAAAAMRAARRK